jgi:enoyl-CoA hydratase/crotonobetainyl-CoA hydratase
MIQLRREDWVTATEAAALLLISPLSRLDTNIAADAVVLAIADHVATIRLNRPEVRNAIDLATAQELERALDQCEADSAVRAIVLSGTDRYFSAGMDLKAVSATGERPITASRGAFGIVEKPPGKPLVAAVEGYALGGGLEIALAGDHPADTGRFVFHT